MNFLGGKFAVVVGVVSRGNKCGELNRAGVYTRVKTALKWIHHVASDGKCSGGPDPYKPIEGGSSDSNATASSSTSERSTSSTTTSTTTTTTDPDLVYPS